MLILIAAHQLIMSNVVLMVEVTALRVYANFLIARVPKVATAFSGSPLDAVSICLVILAATFLGCFWLDFNNRSNFTLIVLQKVRKQGIRFWDERTFWHEMIYKSLIPTFGKPIY